MGKWSDGVMGKLGTGQGFMELNYRNKNRGYQQLRVSGLYAYRKAE